MTTTPSEARPTPTGYPPEHHFLRDLGATSFQASERRALASAPLLDGARTAAGSASLGMLAALVDITAAPVALIAGAPDWTATQDLSFHATGWLTTGPVVVDAHLVRAGVNTVVVAIDVLDGAGIAAPSELPVVDGEPSTAGLARCGTGLLTFARIPRSASASAGSFDPAALVGQERRMEWAEPPVGSMLDRIGLELVDPAGGVAVLESSDYVRNSFGTINGGVLGALFQGAAEAAVPGLVATDVQVHYLSQVKVGPARTSVVVSRQSPDHAVCTARAVDAGNDDQVLSLATVGLQRPPA